MWLLFYTAILTQALLTWSADSFLYRCTGDIFFVMDSSTSIWVEDFNQQLAFVNDLVDTFQIGKDESQVRVGVITFNDVARLEFSFDSHTTRDAVKLAISKIKYQPGGTNTAAALRLLRQELTPYIGNRNRTLIAVVITDGQSLDSKKTQQEAQKIHRLGVKVHAIGVGSRYDMNELRTIASGLRKIHEVTSYAALTGIAKLFRERLCIEEETTTPIPTTTTTAATTTTTAATTTTTLQRLLTSLPPISSPSLRKEEPVTDKFAPANHAQISYASIAQGKKGTTSNKTQLSTKADDEDTFQLSDAIREDGMESDSKNAADFANLQFQQINSYLKNARNNNSAPAELNMESENTSDDEGEEDEEEGDDIESDIEDEDEDSESDEDGSESTKDGAKSKKKNMKQRKGKKSKSKKKRPNKKSNKNNPKNVPPMPDSDNDDLAVVVEKKPTEMAVNKTETVVNKVSKQVEEYVTEPPEILKENKKENVTKKPLPESVNKKPKGIPEKKKYAEKKEKVEDTNSDTVLFGFDYIKLGSYRTKMIFKFIEALLPNKTTGFFGVITNSYLPNDYSIPLSPFTKKRNYNFTKDVNIMKSSGTIGVLKRMNDILYKKGSSDNDAVFKRLIGVIFVDPSFTNINPDMLIEANAFKDSGFELYVVSVGKRRWRNVRALVSLSSQPHRRFLLNVPTYQHLVDNVSRSPLHYKVFSVQNNRP
ncbi:collagen alpha-5(VI) chain-like [Argonauta hians]